MKLVRYLFVLTGILRGSMCIAQSGCETPSLILPYSCQFITRDPDQTLNINDTIIFDMSASYQVSGAIEIPVSFHSSDTIHALDFAFQYNEQVITVDSVTCFVNGLQYFYYYNPMDSTFRFTSNCLTPLPHDSVIVKISFHVYSGPICTDDITNVESWIDGNSCSSRVINCIVSGLPIAGSNPVFTWPVPTSSELNVRTSCTDKMILTDVHGKTMHIPANYLDTNITSLNVSRLETGIYFLWTYCGGNIFKSKIVIAR